MTIKNRSKKLYYEIVSALVITFSVVPGFNRIGNLFLQIFLTASIVILFLSISDRKKISPKTVSNSLIIMCVYWISVALFKQIRAHIAAGNYNFKSWIYLFYYDKPSLLFVVFFSAFVFYAFLYIKKYDDEEYVREYTVFQKKTLVSFTLYYLIILVYCFIIVRKPGGDHSPVNLIPFNIFKVMKAGAFEYEFIFLFFGNIAIFLPLGLIMSVFLKDRHKIVLLLTPFAVSIGVEISQYFIKNGWADIDDVILNVIGFYIGVAVKLIFDKIIHKASKGKINSVFVI